VPRRCQVMSAGDGGAIPSSRPRKTDETTRPSTLSRSGTSGLTLAARSQWADPGGLTPAG
ncbi:MAG: hypothetical protein ACREFY_14795, partial [Acetobacteraceae bacterium]